MTITPFRIDVPDAVLTDLRARLAESRFVADPQPDWRGGTDPGYLKRLAAHWSGDFDWRAAEADLNTYPQFLAEVNGATIHFIYIRATRSRSGPPLILTHGWPSSFVEMLQLVDLLREDFDLVVPSLPGFGYSTLPPGPLTREAIADTWHQLMTTVLGYGRYGAFGGDIGSAVTGWLGAKYPQQVRGIHTIHPQFPADLSQPPLTAEEQAFLDAEAAYDVGDQGYSEIMGTRPDTIAAALVDSPIGLAAWIVDKYRDWSDCDGKLSRRWDLDTVATVCTLYWVTGSIGTSFRQYYDYEHNRPRPRIAVPAAVTLSHEPGMANFPQSLARRACTDLRHWSQPGQGGHFLPFEEPDLMARELREFFGAL